MMPSNSFCSAGGTGLLGSRAIVEWLSEILFIQVIRAYAATAPEQIAFLSALNDEQIGRVLKKAHQRPANLTTTRMLQARLALTEGHDSLSQIAESVGYQSEAALSTAFKRHFGFAPGAYRRRQTRVGV
jgi:transcriptional regulator GlxA family with amidase domain